MLGPSLKPDWLLESEPSLDHDEELAARGHTKKYDDVHPLVKSKRNSQRYYAHLFLTAEISTRKIYKS